VKNVSDLDENVRNVRDPIKTEKNVMDCERTCWYPW